MDIFIPRLEYILVVVDFLALNVGGEGALLIVEMVAGVSAGFSYDDYDADPVQ